MAYTAAVSLKSIFSIYLNLIDVHLPPRTLKIMELAHKQLKSFHNFVERLDSRSRERMSGSLARITKEIRKYENYITSSSNNLVDDDDYEDLSKGINSLVEKLKKVEEEYHNLPEDEEEALSSSRLVSKSKIVGLRDDRCRLKEELVTNQNNRGTFFSLVGMSGIGKTTLAKEIFEDLDISERFNCRAWVTVGDITKWTLEGLEKAILAQLDPKHTTSFSKSLKGKRYLIVLDDLWDAMVCMHLKVKLPDEKDGSRVLLTSTIRFVDAGFDLYFFDVRLLNKEESWDLLCEEVFPGDSCPPQLVDAGKKIADKCDGLPLTILTVAHLLTKAPESIWIDVAEQRKHPLFIHAYDKISKVISRGYKDLRDDLKSCFLYMGVFPLKYEISKSKLINLWIAEDIVVHKPLRDHSSIQKKEKEKRKEKKIIEHSLDSVSVDSLQNLYFSSLIMVCQKSTSYFKETSREKFKDTSHEKYKDKSHEEGIKTCRLHSSWWHFCQREARRTNFFYAVDCPEDGLEEGIKSQGRLSIHNNVLFSRKDVYSSMEEKCASTAQSLLCFGPYHPYQVPVCFGLKLLQRLDILSIRFYDFPLEVVELFMLRYLALTTNERLPPSISKLQKLHYLIVHHHLSIKSCETLSNLPKEIWDMKRLKHLQVMGCDLPDLGDTSLQELSTLSDVTTGSCSVLKRVPNLVKLGIRIELKTDVPEPFCRFDLISHLEKLESLKCVIVNPEFKFDIVSPVPSLPCLPSSLKKLSLSGLGYPWKEMNKIASLSNLEVLKLRYNAFRGRKWHVKNDGFKKLSCLLIEDIDLVQLKWGPRSFRNLAILRIEHCYKLEELQFKNLENIWKVEVVDCNPLVEMKIKENVMLHDFAPQELRMHYSWKS